jgi:lipoate-protein ligase A
MNELLGSRFELLDDGFRDGQYNMDFDTKRLRGLIEGSELPMFRLYGWNPWTLSLGANQKESDINKDEVAKRGFGLVRRPTGGRAVLHANEITYSVVCSIPEGSSQQTLYRDIHSILLQALRKVTGAEMEFEKAQPDFRNFYKTSEMSISCFASSARYEIEWQGRKIVGSAQRLDGRTLLQHGSILIGAGHEQLAYLTKTSEERVARSLEKFILSHSATLEEAAERKITYDECSNAIIEAILR